MFLRPAIRSLSGCSSLIRANHIAHILSPVKLAAPTSSGQIPNLVRLSSSNAEHSRTSPAEPEQIYYGTLSPKIRAVKVFSLSTSIVGLAVQPMLIEQGTKMGGVPMVVFLCGFAGLFTFVTPALLHFITKKYVTHIAYDADKDEYLANTISFFLFKKKHIFKASDVHVPDVTGMFTTFKVHDKALFVDVAQFTDPQHYVRMMGFDKPIDFKLDIAKSSKPSSSEIKP